MIGDKKPDQEDPTMFTRISISARGFAAALMTLAIVSAPLAADLISSQACNGYEEVYPGPSGSTYGLATSVRKATDNARENAWNEIETAAGVPDCSNCPNGLPCNEAHGHTWSPTYGEPYWDNLLKLWRVSVSWENAACIQRCDPCS